jgi:hypothetical protein
LIAEAGTPLELEAIRSGAFEALRRQMRGATTTLNADPADAARNYAQQLMGNAETREKLRALVGNDDAAQLLEAALRREAEIFNSGQRITGGSPTARRTEAVRDFDEAPSGMESVARAAGAAATGNTPGVVRNLMDLAGNVFAGRGMPEARAEELARLFSGATQQEIEAVLRTLEAHSLRRGAQAQTTARVGATAPAAVNVPLVGRFPELPEQEQEPLPPIPPGP